MIQATRNNRWLLVAGALLNAAISVTFLAMQEAGPLSLHSSRGIVALRLIYLFFTNFGISFRAIALLVMAMAASIALLEWKAAVTVAAARRWFSA